AGAGGAPRPAPPARPGRRGYHRHMPSPALRRPENVAGDLYVDETCIDCDTCRWMAPETFDRAGEKSRVHHQPQTPAALQRALMALVACPTASIGASERHDM